MPSSQFEPVTHHEPCLSTALDLLRQRAATHPNQVGFTFLKDGEVEEATLTYAQLDLRAQAIAAWLQRHGASGRRVLLLHRPGLEYLAGFFGCMYAGATAVPAYPPKTPQMLQQLQAIAADSGTRIALTDDLVLSHVAASPAASMLQWVSTEQIGTDMAAGWVPPDLTGEAVAFLQYTSGSTGTPKGVMVTHANLLHNATGCARVMNLSSADREVGWMPLYHDLGLITMVICPLYAGFPSVIMSPDAFLQRPMRWLEAMSRYRATAAGSPNFGYDLAVLKSTPAERGALDLRAWRAAFNGAEPVRAETLQRFAALFGPAGFRSEAFVAGYGLAESTLIVTAAQPGAAPVVRSVSRAALEQHRAAAPQGDEQVLVGCGTAMPGLRVVIVHPERREALAPGAVGEVWVAGASVAPGYWNRPDATAAVFGGRLADTGEGPFLRTGDLGFLDERGELFITGRIKELIIVRGRNHYPADIEKSAQAAVAGLMPGAGAAFTVEVAGEERLVLAQEVKPDFAGEPGEVVTAIRQAVARNHELAVYGVVLVQPGGLPRTMSGKVQRFGARAAYVAGRLPALASEVVGAADGASGTAEPGANTVAGAIAAMVAAALKVPVASVAVDRSLSAYGLDSLAAVEVTHQIEQRFQVKLPLEFLLEGPSVAQVAARVGSQAACEAPAATETGAGDYPVSHGQASMWFLYRMAPKSAAYNIARAVRFVSPVDPDAWRRAARRLSDRHPALRTTFHDGPDGPIQRVHAAAEPYVAVEAAPADLEARLQAESVRPFDLEQGPLWRIHLFQMPDGTTVTHFSMHHIVADLWSLTVFLQELGAFYDAEAAGTDAGLSPVPGTYAAHVQAQRAMLDGEEGERLLRYWKERLGGELPVLGLRTDRPRPAVQSYTGGSRSVALDPALSSAITKLGRKHGATPFATMLALYQAFLHRYTGQTDLIVGSPTVGRTRSDVAGVLGYFVNPVALRTRVDGDEPFTAMLGRVKETVVSGLAHAGYPFPLLVEKLQVERDASRTPIYQTMFVLQRAHRRQELNGLALAEPGARCQMGSLSMEALPVWQQAATCDLTLFAAEVDGAYRLSLEYNTDLFDAATIERMLEHFQVLLAGAVADPEMPVGRLPLMTLSEREQVVFGWNATEAAYPSGSTLVDLFEQQAALTPDAPAVVGALSFAELNQRANRLAHHLRGMGVGPDVLVSVCMERAPELLVALLGVLKAGGAYLPLDPAYPRERLGFMLGDAQAPVLLTQPHLLDRLPEHGARVICDLNVAGPSANPVPMAGPGNLAYVIYTSGSTGRPKGALIEHRGLVNYLWWAKGAYRAEAGAGAPVHSSISFDLTVTSLWTPLMAGRPVHLVDEAQGIEGLAGALRQPGGFSLVKLTPAHVDLVSQQLTPEQAARGAGALVIGGEALLPETLAFWRQAAPGTALINEYGPTETVVGCCVYWVKPGDQFQGSIPIGRPIANTYLYVLDRYLQPVPVGVPGELYIGGDGVCRGYLNRPELTTERFVADPFHGGRMYKTGDLCRYLTDGNLDFLGRLDEQVKLRGFRIELGEIEAGLTAHPSVAAAVALVRETEAGKQLVAYVVPRAGAEIDLPALKAHLRDRVPEYMVPAAFVTLAALPLTANGKVDRKALPAPAVGCGSGEASAPRNPVEERLAAIWAEVLRRPPVSIDENFFELGGDSILSIQVVSRAQQAGLKLTPRDLFQHPTVAGLAEVAMAAGVPASATCDLGPVTGPVDLAPIQRWFLSSNPVDPHHYNQTVLLDLKGTVTAALLSRALTRLVDHHDALRLRFQRTPAGEWQQRCAAPGEVVLVDTHEGYDAAVAERLQASLDLERGPLLRAALFRGAPDRLLIAIHHLAVDGVSWRVLLEDLERLCQQPDAPLPAKTASYREWAAGQAARPVPASAPADPTDTVASEGVVTVSLPAADTEALLQGAPASYRLRPDEVMLTALARALGGEVLVNLEGHGRDGDLDLSRTVGWFTEIHPLGLTIARGASDGEALKAVKEAVRAGAEAPAPGEAPQVSFNYLGRMDQTGSSLFAAAGLAGLSRSPRQLRRHALEIDAMVVGGQLAVRFAFGRNQHGQAEMERLADTFRRELLGLVCHCAAPDAGGCTPSDYPLAGLSQGALDRVTQTLAGRLGLPLRAALREIEEITALTPLQQEMLDATARAPHSGVWTVQLDLGLAGQVNRTALVRAWEGVVERYCQLRSIFVQADRGEKSVRVVWRRGHTPLQVEDWRGAADLDRRVANYLQEDRQHGFRPADLPPVRATLVRTGEEAHRLLLSFHHVLLDGWSTALLLKELFERYAALTNGTTLQLAPGRPYADYVAWLQNLDQTAAHFYWRQQLAGYQPPLPLGAGPARGALMTGAHRDATLSQEVTAGLTAAARRYGVTPGTLVQGAWALLLAGLTGQNDLVFGSVFAGRPAELEGAEAMIGLLMNTLPIRTRLTPSIALGTWLSALQQQVTDAAEHGYVSAAQAARLAALHPTQPLFESAVFFENYPVDESLKAGAAGVRLSGLRFHEQHHYPLSLIAMPGERLGLRVLTHQDRFSPSAAAGLTQRLTDLLEAMATESEPTLQDLLRLARPAAQLAMSAGE